MRSLPDRDDHDQRSRSWYWGQQIPDNPVEDHRAPTLVRDGHGRGYEPPRQLDQGVRPDAEHLDPQQGPATPTTFDHSPEPQRPRANLEDYSAADEAPSPAPSGGHHRTVPAGDLQPIEARSQPGTSSLGWGEDAWAEAGGFAAVMNGPSGRSAEEPGIVVDDLVINLTMLNQNTVIQNTQILFDASDGGSIRVGGDVTAISTQQALIGQSGWDADWADAFASVLAGTGLPPGLAIDELVFTTTILNQNTLINSTEVLFDADNAGVIAVGGDVNGNASQEVLINPSHGQDHGPLIA